MDGNPFTTPLISLFLVLNYWLCGFTNVYLKKTSHLKSSYSASCGPITVEEFCNYIALLFYMSIVTDPNRSAYWSKSSLYCGLWGKHFKTTISCSICKLPFCLNKNRNGMVSHH